MVIYTNVIGGVKMKSVARMALAPNMELGEPVLSYKGDLLYSAGTVLDKIIIARLERYSIMSVMIKEPADYAVTHFEKIRISKEFIHFEEVYTNNLNAYKYMIGTFIETGTPVNIDYLLQIHDNIFKCAHSNEYLLDMLYYMLPSEDDMTYAHTLDAALISKVFGIWLGLSNEDIKTLTLCGFFYDIGKLKIPNSIIWKEGKLADFEFDCMKKHTTLGYDLIKHQKVNEHVLNATLMHHERLDGSGYPMHLKDEDIDVFAKYIAIVDSYDAMTSARTYRAALNPYQVIASFEENGLERYDESIIYPILTHIASDQLGRTVHLSNDITGIVMVNNPNKLSRPMVKDESDKVYDLSTLPDLSIVAIL